MAVVGGDFDVAGEAGNRPDEWAKDTLTRYLDDARQNQFGNFSTKPIAHDLIRIESAFQRLFADLRDPDPWFSMQFFLRAHSTFLVTSSCALAGQAYDCAALNRSALENSAYGLIMARDLDLAAVWMNREHSDAHKGEARRAFTVGKVKERVAAVDPELAKMFSTVYEALIGFGGHPNPNGLGSNSKLERGEKTSRLLTIYLHGDGVQTDFAFKCTCRVGIWTILAFRAVYPALYERAEVDASIGDLSSRH